MLMIFQLHHRNSSNYRRSKSANNNRRSSKKCKFHKCVTFVEITLSTTSCVKCVDIKGKFIGNDHALKHETNIQKRLKIFSSFANKVRLFSLYLLQETDKMF